MHSLKKTLMFLALFSTSTAVLAHAHLTTTVPEQQSTVTAEPQALTLTFTEALEPAFSGVTLSHSGGAQVKTGAAQVDPAAKNILRVPLTTSLEKGEYTVDWHVVSADGHKTKGSYQFTLR